MSQYCLGVDPGPATGIALLAYHGVPLVIQCNAVAAWGLVSWLASGLDYPVAGGLEAFVPGRGAGARDEGAAVTRGLITELRALERVQWHVRSAAAVKPWATDKRLLAAGLLAYCKGMPHAADACRHSLFCAVHDLGWPDPLSKEWRA